MKKRKIILRKCVGCQEMQPKKSMLRVVISPENNIIVDTTGKQNGRGSYICYNEACLAKAIKNQGLERSLKSKLDETLYDEISYTIKRHILLNQGPKI